MQQTVTPVLAVRESDWVEVAVTSAWGGAGSVFANTTDSTFVTLRNVGEWPFEYRVDAGAWIILEPRTGVHFDDVSLATTTFRLRKGTLNFASTARFEIDSLTGDYTVDDRSVNLGGDGGGGGGGLITYVSTVTTNTTLSAAHYTVLVDATAGNVVITLPTAASALSAGVGRVYNVKKVDASANTVTVDGSGAEVIDATATLVLTTQWQSVTIQSNGAAWRLL